MEQPRIRDIPTLHKYLHSAMQLEHATIPPYLVALYSIRPGTNASATQILRVVVVEEMLHLTLAANVLNAVGGTPDLTAPGFVPAYPASLPDGETDFTVDLQPFSRAAIETFLNIERPRKAPDESWRLRPRSRTEGATPLGTAADDGNLHYYSIGEFYEEIERGLSYLHERGERLFVGAREKQVTSEYYYSGGGAITPVTEFDSARRAIQLIIRQGEGFGGEIYKPELAHYYRFDQLIRGRYYLETDGKDNPTGPEVHVDWDAVFPIRKNAKVSGYDDPQLKEAARSFNLAYGMVLKLLTDAYNGKPGLLLDAVPRMFALRDGIGRLVRYQLSPTENAAPTFELEQAS